MNGVPKCLQVISNQGTNKELGKELEFQKNENVNSEILKNNITPIRIDLKNQNKFYKNLNNHIVEKINSVNII